MQGALLECICSRSSTRSRQRVTSEQQQQQTITSPPTLTLRPLAMAQADEESADLTAALACGSAFEEQRGPQGATRALELLSQIKQGSRENGTTARAIFLSPLEI